MFDYFNRRSGKRVTSVMEGGQVVSKRESMGSRFKGELKALVERIHSTEVRVISTVVLTLTTFPLSVSPKQGDTFAF